MTTEIDWAHPAMPRVRYRINVNRLAKGQLSFDCTVEWKGHSLWGEVEKRPWKSPTGWLPNSRADIRWGWSDEYSYKPAIVSAVARRALE